MFGFSESPIIPPPDISLSIRNSSPEQIRTLTRYHFQRIRVTRIQTKVVEHLPLSPDAPPGTRAVGAFHGVIPELAFYSADRSHISLLRLSRGAWSNESILNAILGLKYEIPLPMILPDTDYILQRVSVATRLKTKASLKGLLESRMDFWGENLTSSIRAEILQQVAEENWSALMSKLKEVGIMTMQDKLAYVNRLGTNAHEADHFSRFIHEWVPYFRKELLKMGVEDSVSVMIESAVFQASGQLRPMERMARILATILKVQRGSPLTEDQIQRLEHHLLLAWEKSAWEAEKELFACLAEDSLFSDILHRTSDHALLTQRVWENFPLELNRGNPLLINIEKHGLLYGKEIDQEIFKLYLDKKVQPNISPSLSFSGRTEISTHKQQNLLEEAIRATLSDSQ